MCINVFVCVFAGVCDCGDVCACSCVYFCGCVVCSLCVWVGGWLGCVGVWVGAYQEVVDTLGAEPLMVDR